MNVGRNAAEVVAEHTTLTLECIDRMYLNLYGPMLQSGRARRTSSASSAAIRCRRRG